MNPLLIIIATVILFIGVVYGAIIRPIQDVTVHHVINPKLWTIDLRTIAEDTGDSIHIFSPDRLSINVGDTVRWEWQSGEHIVIAYHPANGRPLLIPRQATSWKSPLMNSQKMTFERVFSAEGAYFYNCLRHEQDGMVGVVLVGNPKQLPSLVGLETSFPDKALGNLQGLLQWAKDRLHQ